MPKSIQYLLRRKGLDRCPIKPELSACESQTFSSLKSKRRITIEHTIETFERCVSANQAPGQFLTEEIIRCLNELKVIKEP